MDIEKARQLVEQAFREAEIPEHEIMDEAGLRQAWSLGMVHALVVERDVGGRRGWAITQWPGTCYKFMLVILMYLQHTDHRSYRIEVHWDAYDQKWVLDNGIITVLQQAAA